MRTFLILVLVCVCIRTKVNAAKDIAPVKYSIDIFLKSFDTVDDFLMEKQNSLNH
jgi:hypothetical protein